MGLIHGEQGRNRRKLLNLKPISGCTILSKKVAGKAHGSARAAHARIEATGLYTARGARKYLNAGERQRVLAAVAALPREKALFVLTLAWTGARVSEVLALRRSSFQLEAGIVALRTLKRRRPSVREVPVPPAVMIALDQHFGLAAVPGRGEGEDPPLWTCCRQTAWRIIRRLMAIAVVDGLPATPRGLRHGFGIGTLQAGVPLNLVQRWLGHARISTTAIYASACGPEELQFAARFWRDPVPLADQSARGQADDTP